MFVELLEQHTRKKETPTVDIGWALQDMINLLRIYFIQYLCLMNSNAHVSHFKNWEMIYRRVVIINSSISDFDSEKRTTLADTFDWSSSTSSMPATHRVISRIWVGWNFKCVCRAISAINELSNTSWHIISISFEQLKLQNFPNWWELRCLHYESVIA